MNTYHKIQSLFKRDSTKPGNPIIVGQYALPEFKFLENCIWEFDEKIDGMNMRIIWDGERTVTYNGKTDRAQIPSNLANALNAKLPFYAEQMQKTFGLTPICMYGEGYGAGIQKGGGYRPDQDFILFDIWCDGWWLKREDIIEIADKFEMPIVPCMGRGTLKELVDVVQTGFNSEFGDFRAEGIVARPQVDLFARSGKRIITKLKCKDFDIL